MLLNQSSTQIKFIKVGHKQMGKFPRFKSWKRNIDILKEKRETLFYKQVL